MSISLAASTAQTTHAGRLFGDARIGAEMDGVDVAHVGLDGVVIGSNLGDGADEAAAHHAAHATAAAALAVAAAISLTRVLVRILAVRWSGTGILSDGCCAEDKNGERGRQKTEFHRGSHICSGGWREGQPKR
jgi:hypothetical protein